MYFNKINLKISNSVLFHIQNCPIWMKSYPINLCFCIYRIYDFGNTVISLWKMAEPRFSLSLLTFIVKFTHVINTPRIILLKWVRACLFTAQNPSIPFHLTLNDHNHNPYNSPHDLTHFLPDLTTRVLSSCPPCWHSNIHIGYWVGEFAFVTDKYGKICGM